ncbi:hypothetical protein INP77_10735 [Methylophilus sp. 13]|uniref:TorF family putative porin n=1 Tax=Methylophilus sp. 13 TaxID=2781018 RepID=UPI00188EEE4A|nr:TorF family putative porin [Methylophilus sp. 13]MBF5039963.1 hypothetical protein [Methylophilus sp. 13]
MRQSILLTAVLSAMSFAQVSYAAEEAKEEAKSDWTATGNIGVVSDYYFRGISQSWHKPTVQGGMDITHSSGFYTGLWGSGVTPNTYPDATTEIDIYAGYNGTIPTVEKLGYTVGIYGYLYPGGSWKKYRGSTTVDVNGNPDPNRPLTPGGGRWDTYEANVGVSYDWISAKLSYTLTDWFGADKSTGWDGSTKGSTYVELNAAYPLPWWDLTLIAHVGRLNVSGKLDRTFSTDGINLPSDSLSKATDPDYTDWKIGLSKAFKIGATEGWNAGVYWIESDNSRYWGYRGYGGSSFNGKGTNGAVESKNLNDGRLVLTLGRTF